MPVTITTFNTLKYANTLKAAGVPDKQAEAQAEVLFDAFSVNLKDFVTKEDLKQAMDFLRADFRADLNVFRTEMQGQFTLLKWMGGVIIPLLVAILVRQFFFSGR